MSSQVRAIAGACSRSRELGSDEVVLGRPEADRAPIGQSRQGDELTQRRILAVFVAAIAITLAVAGAALAAPTWAPAASATIHPGVQTYTDGGQCTANFVFYDASNVYIGQAAHCSGTDGNTATNGCTAHSLPVGTPVEVGGASRPGTMVYNSWITMQQAGET